MYYLFICSLILTITVQQFILLMMALADNFLTAFVHVALQAAQCTVLSNGPLGKHGVVG